jgi:hypothetical protein
MAKLFGKFEEHQRRTEAGERLLEDDARHRCAVGDMEAVGEAPGVVFVFEEGDEPLAPGKNRKMRRF